MRKTNANISMWDVVTIVPSQRRLLWQELESIELKDQPLAIENIVSLVQPSKEIEVSRKIKPLPFNVSLLIGDKLVNNYMIDSGASSSVMPKCGVDTLEMKYEPVKDVLQLDGSIIKTIGILKNVEMALHAYIGCIVVYDILVAEVKPHFSICLSRDFTAQIVGYISFDWSFMFFRTRYGTKASIKAEPLALHHIESYTPNLINMNCTILEEDENDVANEPATSLSNTLDFLLDEWDNAY